MNMDPIGDTIIRIRNAQASGKKEIIIPFSKLRLALTELLQKEGFLSKVKKNEPRELEVALADREFSFARISRLGQRIYAKAKKIPRPKTPLGLIIVSTPNGLMTGKAARQKNLGGEIIGEIN